ncbi:nucleotidyl transferase AbiEii/AbiGii toxin family protein [Streptosporangium sp. NPDC023825]|uniref:nucleotidyl transferase AbiEii/AbiGii toxin family protein n=1 Tax=Streptosporangium sp. NPDC023825 TaxID=3154909 RepID=UPI00343F8670
MISSVELRHWSKVFDATDEQIRRDHLISHVLSHLAHIEEPGLVFYGGTALARTHLDTFRLSEDVDLLARPRNRWNQVIETRLLRALRREFGTVTWTVSPCEAKEPAAALLHTEGALQLKIQVAELDYDRGLWPTEKRSILMRYKDLSPISMTVPTATAFAAMKMSAYLNRFAPRDLADLAELANRGMIDAEAIALARRVIGWAPSPRMFSSVPSGTTNSWEVDLAHQLAALPDPDDCLRRVRTALTEALRG